MRRGGTFAALAFSSLLTFERIVLFIFLTLRKATGISESSGGATSMSYLRTILRRRNRRRRTEEERRKKNEEEGSRRGRTFLPLPLLLFAY
jgi:hypothetical protein